MKSFRPEQLYLFKDERPHRALIFEQPMTFKGLELLNPPQGGRRYKIRRNWMFDNEIDWVRNWLMFPAPRDTSDGTRRKVGLKKSGKVAILGIKSVLQITRLSRSQPQVIKTMESSISSPWQGKACLVECL